MLVTYVPNNYVCFRASRGTATSLLTPSSFTVTPFVLPRQSTWTLLSPSPADPGTYISGTLTSTPAARFLVRFARLLAPTAAERTPSSLTGGPVSRTRAAFPWHYDFGGPPAVADLQTRPRRSPSSSAAAPSATAARHIFLYPSPPSSLHPPPPPPPPAGRPHNITL